ncbi:MAG TPA: hypothetical protein VMA75_01695 [Candidatus Paceibacterota bacterium]|nr:hypothetical protein [Candidatus Paceibacterota bacterium]
MRSRVTCRSAFGWGIIVVATLVGSILFVPRASAAVTFVQAATSTGNANAVSSTFSSAVTAGDTLVVFAQWGDNTSTPPAISSITDTRGNHFVVVTSTKAMQISPPDYLTRDIAEELAYATGTTGGADTVTITYADPSTGIGYMSVIEITASVLDLTSEATGTSAAPSAGTVTTLQNGEFGAANFFQDDGVGNPSSIGPGTGWTMFQQTGGGAADEGGEYWAQSTAGALTGNFTSSNSARWAAGMAVFVPPGLSSAPCDTLLTDFCSTDFFVRGQVGSVLGNSNSTDFSVRYSAQVLALPLMTSADFEITSGVLVPVFKAVKPAYTVAHYQWRNDNGSETGATSATGGIEDSALTGLQQSTSIRLRMEVTNSGGTIFSYSPQSLQLQYGTLSTTCSAISSWTVVGAAGSVWSMYNSTNLTNGANTTNIATSTGGVADANHTFIVANAGVRTTTSTVGAIAIPSDSFIETEFDIEALTSSTPNGTYCFRLTNAGSATNFVYSNYPQATVASAQSITLTLNTSTVTLSGLAPGIAVSATTTATVNVSGATDGYTLEIQRNSATSTLASSSITFPDFVSWKPTSTVCAPGIGNAATATGNTFSFRVASSGTTASYCTFWWGSNDSAGTAMYAGIPSTTQPIVYSTSSASQNGTTTISIIYSANAPLSQKATGYTGGVTITALANP